MCQHWKKEWKKSSNRVWKSAVWLAKLLEKKNAVISDFTMCPSWKSVYNSTIWDNCYTTEISWIYMQNIKIPKKNWIIFLRGFKKNISKIVSIFLFFFLKIFWCELFFSLHWIYCNIASVLCFSFLTLRHVGS